MNAYRLFIALELPEHIRTSILAARDECRVSLPPESVRWTRPEQLHVTLKFLGNVDAERVDELVAAVSRATHAFGPLHLRAGGLGMFPDRHRPRVLWIGVDDGGGRLVGLQRAVEAASAPFTTEKPGTVFNGHVTIGRCHAVPRKELVRFGMAAAAMETRRIGEWTADAIAIVRSELGPGGSRHMRLAAVSLLVPGS